MVGQQSISGKAADRSVSPRVCCGKLLQTQPGTDRCAYACNCLRCQQTFDWRGFKAGRRELSLGVTVIVDLFASVFRRP